MNSRRRITAPEAQDRGIVSRQTSGLEGVGVRTANVRFGSKADIAEWETNVRFTPESGHLLLCMIKSSGPSVCQRGVLSARPGNI
jgi:hypothetical protein